MSARAEAQPLEVQRLSPAVAEAKSLGTRVTELEAELLQAAQGAFPPLIFAF